MRKQYYFRKAVKGFDAWDVDKLVARASKLPVVTVSLDEIKELDENFWYQGKDDIPTCRSMVDHFRLMNETDLTYPIILSKEGKVMDGMHRVSKALYLGHNTIKAIRFNKEIPPDFKNTFPHELTY